VQHRLLAYLQKEKVISNRVKYFRKKAGV